MTYGDGVVDSLCGMFETVDRSVVEILLESNNGDMDKCIDQLLQITQEQESAAAAPVSPPAQLKPVVQDSRWRKPLPEDFLRLPPGVKFGRHDQAQIEHDMLVARMFANEGFRNELAKHEEFRSQLNDNQGDSDWGATWNSLGEAAKTKFNALATQFQRTNDYQEIGTSADEHSFNALLPSNGSSSGIRRRQRQQDEEGMEMNDFGGGKSSMKMK
mmetsp:Transcript_12461/g.26680  ORF Transcript_12461/g.26680 Transcript_12461/m.26680 type:complete len:215 (+) Transcript_12461:91-735(+)